MMRSIIKCGFLSLMVFSSFSLCAEKVIEVPECKGDATEVIKKALEEAAGMKNENVVIKLQPTVYNLSVEASTPHLYHVSNTTSETENPDPTKHIGIWLKDMENITIDGRGATLMKHGEMTAIVIDNCRNIRLLNFKLDAADPSVPEITITKTGNNYIDFDVLAPSQFEVKDSIFYFKGDGWIFGDERRISNHTAIAQIYDFDRDVTLRSVSPLQGYTRAERTGDNSVRLYFDNRPDVKPGERYQLRHSIRNEVGMFINDSKGIEIKDVDFNFLGNFGIVSQFSEDITFEKDNFEPAAESGRTNSGFADFLQFSSCKGLLKILDCRFSGSHDDPINIHGTHLQVVEATTPERIIVAYRHPQTFGFDPFKPGDRLAFVSRETLNYAGKEVRVDSIAQLDDHNYELFLDKNPGIGDLEKDCKRYAVENLTWIPDVEIKGNYFSRTPTRAILITTRGKSVIEDNCFFRTPMASILVADDANSWYESGPVADLTVRNNKFIECKSPVIWIAPEIRQFGSPVHSNIKIEDNRFIAPQEDAIKISASENILIKGNSFEVSDPAGIKESDLIKLDKVTDCLIEGNKILKLQ